VRAWLLVCACLVAVVVAHGASAGRSTQGVPACHAFKRATVVGVIGKLTHTRPGAGLYTLQYWLSGGAPASYKPAQWSACELYGSAARAMILSVSLGRWTTAPAALAAFGYINSTLAADGSPCAQVTIGSASVCVYNGPKLAAIHQTLLVAASDTLVFTLDLGQFRGAGSPSQRQATLLRLARKLIG